MADTAVEGRASRPLSEISENEDRRRASARVSSYSSSLSLKGAAGAGAGSRPASEMRDDPAQPPSKRASGALASLPVHTITLNLADYTGTVASTMTATAPATPTTITPPVIATKPLALQSPSTIGSGAPSPTVKSPPPTPKSPPPAKPEKPAELSAPPIAIGASSSSEQQQQPAIVDLSEPVDGISPLFVATRASLRPTASGKDLQPEKPPSPPATLSSTGTSFDSARSSIDVVKAPPKSKAKWLKRASMAPLLGSKSVSPASSAADLPAEAGGRASPGPSTSSFAISAPTAIVPPTLPPRKFPTGPMDHVPASGPDSAAYAAAAMRPQPPLPGREPSSTAVTHHHPSASARNRWWGGQPTSAGVTRSPSNNSIMSTASAAHQRLPSGAQRVLGQAGNAVTKGWNRARGVGGSISGMGGFAPVRSNSNELDSRSVSPRNRALGHTLARKPSRDLLSTDLAPATPADSFQWAEGVVKRPARAGYAGRVFGRELQEAGRAWTVVDAHAERPGDTEYELRRRQCLPAIVVRAVECLIVWGPKEEGIFRISGRSSHLVRLRREFDGGADLDLSLCDAGDLDPHSVAGIFKSYIRELPTPMVPIPIEQEIEELLFRTRSSPSLDELLHVLGKLPASHWFLLADVIMLLDFIPQHEGANRMTRQALMLSLGPTLRLSGDVVDVLVRHRQDLFRNPPMVDPSDLVDFGDEPMVLPLSPAYTASSLPDRPKPPASRRISKRPSLGNLLGGTLMRRSQSDQTLGFSPTTAPRLALPEPVRVDLPMFGGHTEDIDETEELESLESHDVARATDRMEDAHYAPGTVAARAAAFGPSSAAGQKTPIADRFQRSSTERVDNLLGPKGGSHSSGSSASSFVSVSESFQSGTTPPVNPIVAIRRSPPLFFASAVTTGTKRKDETNAERSNESARDSPKRLSSGPGPTDDDLAVRP